MVTGLLDMLDRLVETNEEGRRLTSADVARFREHATQWREQVERLRQRIGGATTEPPRSVQ